MHGGAVCHAAGCDALASRLCLRACFIDVRPDVSLARQMKIEGGRPQHGCRRPPRRRRRVAEISDREIDPSNSFGSPPPQTPLTVCGLGRGRWWVPIQAKGRHGKFDKVQLLRSGFFASLP